MSGITFDINSVTLRKALPDDAAALLSIYSYYVENTAVSFEYDPPTVGEFRSRIERFSAKYPYIIAELDGVPIGYAYAHAFHERAAFLRCAELTVYLDRDCRGHGLGRLLYTELERRLAENGIVNLYALIAVPRAENDPYLTRGSLEFHRRMGFEIVGELHSCGLKFGRLYNMAYAEKVLCEENTD